MLNFRIKRWQIHLVRVIGQTKIHLARTGDKIRLGKFGSLTDAYLHCLSFFRRFYCNLLCAYCQPFEQLSNEKKKKYNNYLCIFKSALTQSKRDMEESEYWLQVDSRRQFKNWPPRWAAQNEINVFFRKKNGFVYNKANITRLWKVSTTAFNCIKIFMRLRDQ